ncbi:hypothetical protein BJX61DRAFT_492537 [Aspergillus egyptiacus]|nr:hypothetical protein BJX61DRAFT_492537 [Aspergillus egyptiacus]
MKSAISPDIWETKRMLITKLYKDEEWPLKQVIKLVQTSDFHPSESQLRSRLKKWHITKPSRKKYDGSRRLSNAKKNQQNRTSDPSTSTYNTLPPRPKTEESDAFSDLRSDTSRPALSLPELSTSPTDHYLFPSSPYDEPSNSLSSPVNGMPMMVPQTPLTPVTPVTRGVYGMEESKPAHEAQTIYFCPPDYSPSEFAVANPTGPSSYPAQYAPFLDPSPLSLEPPQTEYMGYAGVHYIPGPAQTFPPPQNKVHPGDGPLAMTDQAGSCSWAFHGLPESPTEVYPPPHSFFQQQDCLPVQPLVPPIYPTM